MKLLLFISILWSSQIINRSVGQVGTSFITSRDVQLAQAIEGLLYMDKKRVEADINDNGFSSLVTATLVEWVVSMEAENFSVAEITEDETVSALQIIDKQTQDWDYWTKLKPTKEEIKLFVVRKIKYKKFFQFKTQASKVNISDSEAKAYFDKNKQKFGSAPFVNFKDNIKSFLSQQYRETRIREWFELLKRKYKVRNFEIVRGK